MRWRCEVTEPRRISDRELEDIIGYEASGEEAAAALKETEGKDG